jgi:hypothetical protein
VAISLPVNIACTPGIDRADSTSMLLILACAHELLTNAA